MLVPPCSMWPLVQLVESCTRGDMLQGAGGSGGSTSGDGFRYACHTSDLISHDQWRRRYLRATGTRQACHVIDNFWPRHLPVLPLRVFFLSGKILLLVSLKNNLFSGSERTLTLSKYLKLQQNWWYE